MDTRIANHNEEPRITKKPKKKFIICSAIWFRNGISYYASKEMPINIIEGFVATGRRHSNCFKTLSLIFDSETVQHFECEQGFLTSSNYFVTRKEAAEIAFQAGQVKDQSHTLISEDLY